MAHAMTGALTVDAGVHIWDLGAIRARLDEIGLDWEQPPYPPAAAKEVVPLVVKVSADG